MFHHDPHLDGPEPDVPPIMPFSTVGPPIFTLDDVTLVDDGTLDTVLEVKGRTLRFFDASEFRSPDGTLDLAGFVESERDHISEMLEAAE